MLNTKVGYHQGLNGKVKRIQIPLYLKIIDFFSRHYHYQELAKEIVGSSKTDEEKVFSLFEWTYRNIKNTPEDFPIVDDHVWHTIIRGYGVSDQYSDVFTTLCNYSGVGAFFTFVWSRNKTNFITVSYVKIKRRWRIFDPYRGSYFKDKEGNLADVETVKSGNYSIEYKTSRQPPEFDYSPYIANLPSIKEIGLNRANTQSPLNRFLFEIKKRLSINNNCPSGLNR